jgi:protein involved in polysaccharide export with SLBB domain
MGGAMSRERRQAVETAGQAEGSVSRNALVALVLLAVGAGACSESTRRSPSRPLTPGPGLASMEPTAVNPTFGFDSVPAPEYRVSSGDLIDVKFAFHPEQNQRLLVAPDGRIGLQAVGEVLVAGRTVQEIEDELVERASVRLRDPVVEIVVVEHGEHRVYVGGQVAKPGYVTYRAGLTPLHAIVERGGFVDDANTDEVLHIRRVGDQVQSQRLDLEAVMDGDSSEQVIMSPDDVIIVPRTFIGEADVWVDHWIRGLLPTVPRPGLDLNTLAF